MISLKKDIIIAIDGYSSCGKSTAAKSIAKELNYIYIDSGAMYRAATLFCLRNNMIKNGSVDVKNLLSRLSEINIAFKLNRENLKNEIYLNGENVEEEIRNMTVSDNVSPVSKIAEVRKQMVHLQREMGRNKRIVMDGRDIGTVVFPEAELKLFMTANADVRAERRFKEFLEKGQNIPIDDVKENIAKRDYIDANREESPLRKADDAIVLDNSNMTREEQFLWIKNLIEQKFSA
ncbi:MAG: (d)CMP kinase [Bacteroidia bacterium]|nr:(d)CMP kinase [Bacteroidia bacterium]